MDDFSLFGFQLEWRGMFLLHAASNTSDEVATLVVVVVVV
jgi:hypothetical protein